MSAPIVGARRTRWYPGASLELLGTRSTRETMHLMLTFDDALAQALDRLIRGEPAEAVAACYPEYDVLPYLHIAQQIKDVSRVNPNAVPPSKWMRRSLQRLLQRKRHQADPAPSQA